MFKHPVHRDLSLSETLAILLQQVEVRLNTEAGSLRNANGEILIEQGVLARSSTKIVGPKCSVLKLQPDVHIRLALQLGVRLHMATPRWGVGNPTFDMTDPRLAL